jgi:hypothetical protein
MPFRHGKATGVYVGNMNASPVFNSFDVARTVDTHDVTGFESEAKSYIAGQADGTLTLSGFFDVQAVAGTGIEEQLATLRDSEAEFPTTIFLDGGVVVGRQVRMASTLQTAYNIASPATDVATASMDLQADLGVRFGKCLHARAAVTGSVITGTACDFGTTDWLATSNGFAHIHVTDNTRSAAVEVKIQQSADNSVWVDHATYSVTASTKPAVTIPTTGTNLRYARVLITPTAGTGSATIVVAFARAY